MTMVTLTEQTMTQYQRDGYCAMPHFFDAREVRAMVVELERFKREGLGRNVVTEGDGQTHSRTKINYQIIPQVQLKKLGSAERMKMIMIIPMRERMTAAVALIGPVMKILAQNIRRD